MSTPIGRKVKSTPARRPLGLSPEASSRAEDAAETVETPTARAPRGPFKILTIPQAWYDTLHADRHTGAGEGDDTKDGTKSATKSE